MRALAALGLEPGADVPLVGDRRHDAEAAHANGLRCVGVLWGIGDEAELRAAGLIRSCERRPAASCGTGLALSRSLNTAPSAFSALTDPPCCSATWRTIASPSPEPGRPRAVAPR